MALFLAVACATTDFAETSSPVTITEQWQRDGPTTWGGPRIFRIGNIEMGFEHGSGSTYTVDPGTTALYVWYYGNRHGFKGIFTQTDMVRILVTLAPNARYELRAEAGNATVDFSLVDLGTNREVASVTDVPIVIGPSRIHANRPMVVPIYIPSK
jgi:hypothetical protein